MSDEVTGTPASAPAGVENNVASVQMSIAQKLEAALNGASTNGTQTHAEPNFAPQPVQASQPPIADQTAAPVQPGAATEPNAAAADTRPRDPVTGQFLANDPEIEFGEYGKVKGSEVQALHGQLIEFERNQAAIRYQQEQAARSAAETQAQAHAQQAEQLRQSEAYMVQWAQRDPQALIDFLTSKAVASGYAPQQPQYGQPQQNPFAQGQQPQQPLTPDQVREMVRAEHQQMQVQAQNAAARQAHFAQVEQQFNTLIDSAIPLAQYGDHREDMVLAVKSMVRDAPQGTFVPGMPIPLVMRKIANYVNSVKGRANTFLAGRRQQQAQITGGVAPQPQGSTMIPKTEKPPYEPFNEASFTASFENRFKEHMTGL